MQPLLRALQDRDLGYLRILSELWGLDPSTGPASEAARALSAQMLRPEAVVELIEGLDPPARAALDFLLSRGGRAPLADVLRRYGPFREMGPGRRDREKPWRAPASPFEALWYRGLVSRAFAETTTGPQEFAFVPPDLGALIPAPATSAAAPPGGPTAAPEHARLASAVAVEDATTLLAALRRKPLRTLPPSTAWLSAAAAFLTQPEATGLLLTLLHEMGILEGPPWKPTAEPARAFLDAPTGLAVQQLLNAWGTSGWNDLASLPGLAAPGDEWPNDPRLSRRAALDVLRAVPAETWWDLETLLRDVRERQPGFLRPAGDFEVWYLRDAATGDFLRGLEHWQAVDGAYLRHLIVGPLHWLGAAEVGNADSHHSPASFRLTAAFRWLFGEGEADAVEEPSKPAVLYADGRIEVPPGMGRAARYQLARVCTWEPRRAPEYAYRLTPRSLESAMRQGLNPTQVLAILEAACQRRAPAPIRDAIDRWASRGTEARLERHVVLRLHSPAVLQALRAQPATARYLREVFGKAAAIVLERDLEGLRAAAARLGILIDSPEAGFPDIP